MGILPACLSAPMPPDLQLVMLPNHTLRCSKEDCEDDREATGIEKIEKEK